LSGGRRRWRVDRLLAEKVLRAVIERRNAIGVTGGVVFNDSVNGGQAPGYLNQAGTLNIDHNSFNDFFANNSFGTFGKFTRLKSRLSYLYGIKNGNKLRFTYQWDYYKMKNISGKTYNIEHSFIMTYLFNY
jgi:hypothetical protein